MPPLITIATSVFNGSATLQRCIDSVAGQTFGDVEHVIIDGGSTDGTVDILKANDSRLAFWVSEKDSGIYDAWNKAIEHSHGDWLLFLGCDDYLWSPQALNSVAAALSDANPEHRLVYGLTNIVDSRGEVSRTIGEKWETARRTATYMLCYPNPSAFYHKSLFTDYGRFDTSYRYAGDYEFSLRFIDHEAPLFVDGPVISGFTVGGVSNNERTVIRHLREACRAWRTNDCPGLPTGLYGAMCRTWLRMACRTIFSDRGYEAIERSLGSLRRRGRPIADEAAEQPYQQDGEQCSR